MNTIHSVSNTSHMRSSEAVAVRNRFSFRSLMMRVMLVMMVVGLGNVVMAQELYKTLTFSSSYNSRPISSYTDSWYVTIDSDQWDMVNFNNNSNGWNYVKAGRKNNASVATITTNSSYSDAITKVDVTIDAITASKINSIKLYTSSNGSTWTEAGTYTKATGKQSVNLSSPSVNLYYKIEFNCASGSSNGLIQISKVEYYRQASRYTVSFDPGSGSCNPSSLQEGSVGSGVTLPTATAPGDCSAIYTFYGWAATSVSETSTAPSIVGTYGETYFPASNTTLHAVYRRVDGDIVYNLVENLSTVSEGKYYLLTPDYHAFNGTISSGHGQATANAFSFTNGVATSAPDGAVELTLSSSGDGFAMYNATYGYLYARDNTSGNLAWHNSESSYWEYLSSNWVYDDNSAYLRTFSNSSFRTYNGNTNDVLLMAMEYEPAIFNTNPSCPSVTLTYNANDATSGTAPVDLNSPYNAGSRVTVLGKGTLEKTNYDFLGWNTTADGSGTEYSEGSHLYITESTVLYAQWGKKYEVTFNKGTGNCDTPSLTETNACVGVTLPEATPPARCSDYTFYGWSTSEISETSSEPLIVGTTGEHYYPSSDITLYAVYRQPNGGTVYNLITDLSTITEGEYYLVSTSNYAFNGSIRSGHGQATPNEFSFTDGVATSVPDGAVELTLSSSGYGFTMYNATYGYLYASAASSGNLAWHNSESSYWKYSNSNWTYNDNSAYLRVYDNTFRTYGNNSGNSLKMAKKVDPAIYNTRPSCNTATVTYNSNGASGEVTDDNNPYDINETVTVLGQGNLENECNTFAGWNTSADGSGTSYQEDDTFTITENVTLYAQWTPVLDYTISWLANGQLVGNHNFGCGSNIDVAYVPEDASITSAMCDGSKILVGWSDEEFEETNTPSATIITHDDFGDIAVTGNKNYYAVFAEESGTGNIYSFAGGTSTDLLATGATANGLGSDYAVGNAPYRVKFDGTGDYIVIPCSSTPISLTIDVKMIGGSASSTLRIQASTNGVNYVDVQSFTISGAQNDILSFTTTNAFPLGTSYVKIYFIKGSNVGVGPITINGVGHSNFTTFCPCAYGIDGISNGDMVWAGKNANADWNSTINWTRYNEGGYHLTATAPTSSNNVYIIEKAECEIDALPHINENTTCNNLTMFNGLGIDIAENQTLTINGTATFTNGVINGNVIFGSSATVSGASTSSHVDGIVTKSGTANGFTFPTGSNGNLGKVVVTDGTATDVSVQYFSNPAGFGTNDLPRWWNAADMSGENPFNHVSNVEYWRISSTDTITANFIAEASTDMHFNSETDEEDRIPANIQMAFYDNNRWTNVGGSASIDGNTLSINGAEIPASATRGISGNYTTFGSKSKSTVLPIELVSFTANCNGRSALIEWTTATEKNNDFFVLERSYDALNFKEIARIAGAGNSIEPISYAYTDFGVRNGDNYYRLVQVDYDGTSTASEIIVANCLGTDGEPEVLAYPNPFGDDLTLRFENFGNIQATVEVYDMLGRMVHTQKVNCSQNDYEVVLRLAGLSDGTYNVRISAKEFVLNKKVVKQ